MQLPTKELLSAVLDINDIDNIYSDLADDNEITYTQYANLARGTRTTDINIYELMHLMKEWARTKGYLLLSGYDNGTTWVCECTNKSMLDTYTKSEPEAVTKACEWILEQQG